MFWLLVLSTVFLGVGVIVFVLTRDSFRASRVCRETPLSASSAPKSREALVINTMMREKLSVLPPSQPATLLAGQNDKETDALADSLAQVRENRMLPSASKAYLRLEERDESLEHLLIRRSLRPREGERVSPPPREFSIEVTEK